MRGTTVSLAILVLLAGPLAGCLGGGGDADREAQGVDADDRGQQFAEIDASENATYLLNQDYSNAHIHDYWAGAEERVLMDEVLMTDTLRSVFVTAFWPFISDSPEPRGSVGTQFFTLPNGTFVPEGAGELIVEIDATGALKGGEIDLSYKAADSEDFVSAGPQPAQAAWTITLTPTMADMPHSSSTRWYFWVNAAGNGAVLDGSFNVKITAKKVFDIEAWPEHPDFWQRANLTRLDLVNASGEFNYLGPRNFGFLPIDGAEPTTVTLPAGTLVPPETEVVVLDFYYELPVGGTNTLNGDVWLDIKEGSSAFFGGDRVRGFQHLILEEPGHKMYAVPADETNWDSPYAAESSWAFMVHATSGLRDPSSGAEMFSVGLAEIGQGTFTLDVKAFRIMPPWLEQEVDDEE